MELSAFIRDVPDFPEPGIVFKDITPMLANNDARRAAVDELLSAADGQAVTMVAGIESRGFILGVPVAERLGVGFIPIRKAGKLPAETHRVEYSLEYGTDALELHVDACDPNDRVLIIDDVLATGGTLAAAVECVEATGATVVGASVLIELTFLAGRTRNATPIHSVFEVA